MYNRDPKIAVMVRKLLKKNQFLYSFFGNLYHNMRFLLEFLYLKVNYPQVKVFYPNFTFLESIKKSAGYKSQFGQDYFLDKMGILPEKNGTFIDIGCNHPENENNTFYFENNLNYSGISIDPIANQDEYKKLRSRSEFIKVAISNIEGEMDFVEVVPSQDNTEWHSMLSGSLETVDLSGRELNYSIKKVPTMTLEGILSSYFTSSPDLMSVDVEGHEMKVLESYSWTFNKPRVIVIENVGSISKQSIIRNFLISKNYTFKARIWISDDIFILN